MIWFTKWALRNKAAVILMIVLSLGLGALSYFTLPKEFLPAANNPMVTVIVMGQGTDADTMADQVTKPIEKAIGSVKGKKHVFSTSADGYTSVDISLDPSVDMKEAKAQVQEAVSGLQLPEGYSKPIVSQLNLDMIPLWQIALSFPNGINREDMEKIENEIVPTFQGISGVGNVSVYGKQQTQINVKLDKDKMSSYQIPVQALMGILQGKNLAVAVGEETIDDKKTNLKVIGQIEGKQELENIQIAPDVLLKDIASVEVSDSSSTFFTRVNGEEAVALLVFKESNANAVAIGKKVNETMKQVNKDYKSNIETSMIVSFSDFIVQSVDSMMESVLLGALFATIVIFFFLRHLRMTVITVISIPLSLGLTLFLLSQSGITLNVLTIGAVAVAVGRLVDDSIVVIENIFRKAQNGDFSKHVIVDATKEVASAITSSTLTTVAVFLPMGLVKSMQEILLPFALTITYALISSLLVALIVVPLMSSRLLKKGKLPSYKKPENYIQILNWCLSHKWVPLVLSFLIFVGAIGMYFVMPKGAEKAADKDVSITMVYPDDVPFTKVKDEVLQLETFIKEQSGVEKVSVFLGSNPEDAQFSQINSQNTGDFYVVMKSGANTQKFMEQIEKQKEKYSDAEIDAMFASIMGSGNSTITIDVVGNETEQLIQASEKVIDEVKGIDGVEKVTSNQEELKSVYDIVIDQEKANTEEVARQVQLLLNPFPIGTIKLEGKDTMVLLDSSINPTSEAELKDISVAVNQEIMPLSSIAKIEKSKKPTSVLRKDGNEYVRINIQVDPKKLSEISNEINLKTNDLTLPKGVSLETAGAASAQDDQFMELFQLMAVSIGLVYLIMVLTFKTLRAPLVILFTLPLAIIGAVLGLLISQTPVDIGSMIGALMLIGIVVTNAIVLLDRVRQNEETMPIREALLEAGATRFRPIIMTALATIFAMIPLLMGKEEMGSLVSKGLAVVVIGGLSVATLLTLVIIPVVYELFHFKKAKKQRLAGENTVSV
ncbi:efflux RND transporter permease subunit [Lederbergia citrea]|uniref:Efflux RND transporter permease subunit n=1 Tax=Lederbergia citrea TaxID=2833581 RepID=A0A942Z628_9BACI|nr:efflux RND transporter permease subunit [Lederbergia citrea]MBS4205747.1 efflux RND transporter permease subunit [Lederbergia citrea]MBS4223917.1 efflux RND transporter permease subunit [Lederbergia citrea]